MNTRKLLTFATIAIILIVGIFAILKLTSNNSGNGTITPTKTPQATAVLTYELPFSGKTIKLTRSESGKTADTFWGSKIVTVSANGVLDSLYNRDDWGVSLYYDTPKNAFYLLNPGGYERLSLVTSSYITDLAKPKNQKLTQDELTGTTTYRTCAQSTLSIGNINNVIAVACTDKVINDEFNDVNDESTITSCFIPVSSGNYLALELPMRPVGTTMNLCDSMKTLGIQTISESTK